MCYNPKLGSGCNLGKGLSKRRENNQCKDTGSYLQLYKPKDHEERERHPWENSKKEMRKTWGNLYYYMRHWLIIHEKGVRHSEYESKMKQTPAYGKHKANTYRLWDIDIDYNNRSIQLHHR